MTVYIVHFTAYDFSGIHSVWSTEEKAEECIATMTEWWVDEGDPRVLEVTIDGGGVEPWT